MTISRAALTSLLAVGLVITFFMPWIHVLFIKASGLDFAKEGGVGMLLWAIPFFAGFTILGGITNQDQRVVGVLTGFTPLFTLFWGLSKHGGEIFQVMQPGAWIGLCLGVALIIVAGKK